MNDDRVIVKSKKYSFKNEARLGSRSYFRNDPGASTSVRRFGGDPSRSEQLVAAQEMPDKLTLFVVQSFEQ
jgi:hypothetical protein